MTKNLQLLAKKYGTPLLIIDHTVIRKKYLQFRKYLPRVGVYYALKANPLPEIVRTLHKLNSGFDVASQEEFEIVMKAVPKAALKKKLEYVYNDIILANTIKPVETLKKMIPYRTLMTFDNIEELKKIKKYCPNAGLIIRLKVPNIGSMVELSSKFGIEPSEAMPLIDAAIGMGMDVEGISFHVGSQCMNIENYMTAFNRASELLRSARAKGYNVRLLNIGGGFPANYEGADVSFPRFAKKLSNEIDRLFPKEIEIVAEPGRYLAAEAAKLVVKIIGKAYRGGKTFYYINDGVYNTLSGVIFDHCVYHFRTFKKGKTFISAVVGPTCDALDTVSLSENLPDMRIGDLLYVENIGAYSNASATNFNGFSKAKIVHIND
ncbi:MAG: type III PLP-dependent enzyme [bacterium]